eukprot:COSAG01_NODE_30423_length_616_cov_1.023211_1_plen_22_part_01
MAKMAEEITMHMVRGDRGDQVL